MISLYKWKCIGTRNRSLRITDSASPTQSGRLTPSQPITDATNVDESNTSAPAAKKKKKNSLWIPNDQSCPQLWCVHRADNTQSGPYRVSELLREFDQGNLTSNTLLTPLSNEEDGDEESADKAGANSLPVNLPALDTGRWRPVSQYLQLQIQLQLLGSAKCKPSTDSLYSPAEIGDKCLKLLQRIADVHKDVNSKGDRILSYLICKFHL